VPVLLITLVAATPAGAAVFLSPSGSDSAPCTSAAPCRSLDRGYRAAAAGDEVVLAGGAYGEQELANLPAKGSAAKVIFHPAEGASVKLGYLGIANSQNVEVRDMETDGWGVTSGSAHVVLRNLRVLDESDGGFFSGADDVQVIGGEIGRIDPSAHDDCVQTGDVTNLVIRDARFVNCGTQGVFLNPYNGGASRNITIENTWFGPAQLGYNSLYIGDAVGVTVRNNSFTQNMYIAPTSSGVSMVNNILGGMDANSCQSNADNTQLFDYNMSAASCAGAAHHTINASLASQYVSTSSSPASALDLHLKPGGAAIDRGSPSNYAATDFDGNVRPAGNAPDIGSHEYGAGPPGPASPDPAAPAPVPAAPVTPPAPRRRTLSDVLHGLPPAIAAAVLSLPDPRLGTKAPITVAGFEQTTVCRRARRGCRRTSTRLRIVLTRATTLTARFRRVRPGHRARVVRRSRLKARAGSNLFRIRARGLRAGRYHVVISAPNGAEVDLRLRVR
jgi:hypothetical protein